MSAPKSLLSSALERYSDPVLVALVAVASWVAIGYQPNAEYPRGDGGLFYEVIRQLADRNLHAPDTIAFNGFAIPFAYSPGSFIGCALLAKVLAISIPRAMNLWVGAWVLAFAPLAVYTARQFGLGRFPSLVAAAVMVTLPQQIEWLGFGGGLTRAPGFALSLLTVGACWHALGSRRVRDAGIAGACAGSIALFHMEFAFLAAVTFGVLCVYRRPSIRTLAAIGATAVLVTTPWLVSLARHPLAGAHALQSASLQWGIGNVVSLLEFFGIDPANVSLAGDAGLLAIGVVAFTAGLGETMWLVWVVALFAVDQRAAFQVAHIPIGLAAGALAARRYEMPMKRAVNAGVVVMLIGLLCASADRSSKAYRMTGAAAADLARIGKALPRRATVLVLPSLGSGAVDVFAEDQTFEWFPAFAPQRSLFTYVGLEWVDRGLFNRMWQQHSKTAIRCLVKGAGPACVLASIRKADLARMPLYVYVSRRTSGKLVAGAFDADSRFTRVLQLPTALVFRVGDEAVAQR